MTFLDTYTYLAPTKPLRDWLRLQSELAAVGAPVAAQARVFASLLPGGTTLPAVAFHRYGGGVDNTLDLANMQFDCYGPQPEDADTLAATLATLLASTPPRTVLPTASGVLMFQGPAVILDTAYLPVQTTRVPRQILRAQLTFAAL